MGLPGIAEQAVLLESVEGELPDRLQHPESTSTVGRRHRHLDQAVLHEGGDGTAEVERLLAGHRAGGGQVEGAREHSQAGERGSFGLVEQGLAPLDGGPHALLTVGQVPGAVGEEDQQLLETVRDGLGRPHARLRGGELDRQGHAVQSGADVGDGSQRLALRTQTGLHGPGALEEERTASLSRMPDSVAPVSSGRVSGGTRNCCSP